MLISASLLGSLAVFTSVSAAGLQPTAQPTSNNPTSSSLSAGSMSGRETTRKRASHFPLAPGDALANSKFHKAFVSPLSRRMTLARALTIPSL